MFAVIGALLIVGGGMFLRSGLRLRAQCREAEVAEVLNTTIDLSKPGSHRATLNQIAAFPCRQYIRMKPDCRAGENATELLRGLELTVEVQDGGGVEWMSGTFPSPISTFDNPDAVTIVDSRPMPVGEYSVEIDVVWPAPALAGRPVRFTSSYVLCGIEWMGPIIGIGGGAAAVALGAVIGVALLFTRRARGKGVQIEANLTA